MSANNCYLQELTTMEAFFTRSTSALDEADSGFAPTPELMTVAQQVAHVAHSVDWFIDGAFRRKDGFDLDFEGAQKRIDAVTSLKAARASFKRSVENAVKVVQSKSMEELMAPLPAGPVMGGAPKCAIFAALADHTAHHRGSLAVYARLLGKTPPMPYM